ncbi:MAG TPA: hypothetical protein PK358_15135 [Spirochaetota bacterium]|nr:hypothetical protein [Spirochaetota bacterium]
MTIEKKFGRTILVVASLILAFTLSGFAQEAKELDPKGSDNINENFNQAEKPDDSYLAKFHANDVAAKLVKKNLEQIYLLNVIVTNFDKYGWKGDYDKIYEEYKRAIELYYKRDTIFARVWFERNQKSISDLMKKMSDQYDKDTQGILDKCHSQIVALHLNQKTRSDPNKHKELLQNQMRLRIAYGQMDDARNEAISRNYEQSLYHYRVAKSYGIRILETVAYTDEADGKSDGLKVKDIKETYKKDKADNRNRIYEDIKKSSSGSNTNTNTNTQ